MTADRIFLSSPDVTEAEEAALVRAFRTGWIAPLGPEVDAFEAELAERCGRAHCVALSSGTAALHLGLLTLRVEPGDLVVTSSMTFAATANAITYVGAEPVFVDADASGNMNPDLLQECLADLARMKRRVAAVIPVDLLGKVVDHGRIDEIAAQFGVPVLSDAAESLGAVREGRPAASFGVAAAVSFNGNKIVTTSGGGAYLTDDADAAARVRYLATQARQPVVHYEHTDIGYNYRLSNLLAAVGRAQLERLDAMMERRRQLRLHYRDLFAGTPGVELFGEPSGADTPGPVEGTRDNFWLTSILVDPTAEARGTLAEERGTSVSKPARNRGLRSEDQGSLAEDRGTLADDRGTLAEDRGTLAEERGTSVSKPALDPQLRRDEEASTRWLRSDEGASRSHFTADDIRHALAAANIESRPLWKPMHLQPVFSGAKAYVDGTSERLFATGLSLPSGSVLTDADVARIDAALAPFLGGDSARA